MSATAVKILPNYINGAWVPSSASETLDIQNPATGEVLAQCPLSGAGDVDTAVQAARAAFPEWKAKSTIERARWLFGFRQRLEEEKDRLATCVTTEMGKTFPDARAEVERDRMSTRLNSSHT